MLERGENKEVHNSLNYINNLVSLYWSAITLMLFWSAVSPNWRFGRIQQSNCRVIVRSRQPSDKATESMYAFCVTRALCVKFPWKTISVAFFSRLLPFKVFRGPVLLGWLQLLLRGTFPEWRCWYHLRHGVRAIASWTLSLIISVG